MKESVCALIYRNGKILGVSRKDDPDDFGLIGGKVDRGETRAHALGREIKEETGLDIIKGKLIFVRDDHGYKCYVYICEVDGSISTNEAGIVKELTWDDLFNGKTFGEFNRKLYESLENQKIKNGNE